VPLVVEQLRAQAAALRLLSVDADGHPFELHRLAGIGIDVGIAGAAQADVDRPGVHGDVGNGGDAAPALLLDARRDDRFERAWRLQSRRHRHAELFQARGVERSVLALDLARIEFALAVRERERLESARRERRRHEPHVRVDGEICGRRSEEIGAADVVCEVVAWRRVRLLRLDFDFDSVGDELLDLEVVRADDVFAGDDVESMAAGSRVRRQRELERCDTAVAGVDAHAFALVVRIEVLDDERHLRRRFEPARAHDGDAFERLARAVDVALAVDECGVAVFRNLVAGDVERREVDFRLAEDQKAVVVAVLHGEHERLLLRLRQLGHVVHTPEAARIGAAGGEHLVLIADERDACAVDRAEVFER
jgi:hypothetical protein